MRTTAKILKWVLPVMVLIFIAEFFLRSQSFSPAHTRHLIAIPANLFKADANLGWIHQPGKFKIGRGDTANTFVATFNVSGNRITSTTNENSLNDNRPQIQVYGDEYTIGFSIPDSATSCYKLQQLLPKFNVSNKSCMAYGLAQMYLSLKKSVETGDTPAIAIFNYGSFQDERTPLCRGWSSMLAYTLKSCCTFPTEEINYPSYDIKHDSIVLSYKPLSKIAHDWPLRNKSSFVNLLNTMFDMAYDKQSSKVSYLHIISEKTAYQIALYCKLNHITPVFAGLTADSEDILQRLSKQGFYTLNYGIEVLNDSDEPNRYNCGTADPQHPNSLANTIYADKIYALLRDKKIITRERTNL